MTKLVRPALAGIRVVDLTMSIAGQYCGRLLADYGAEVVLVEPETGSPTRGLWPKTSKRQAPENSLLFRHINTGKRSVIVGSDEVRKLCADADIILVEAPDRQALGEIPGAIVCSVSDFGTTGPYRDWLGGEMIQHALSGVMHTTGAFDREPLYGVGQRSAYAAGVTAFTTVLTALYVRERSGLVQDVETTVSEACAAMGQQVVTQYSFTQTYAVRGKYEGGGMMAQIQLKDGWIIMWVQRNWPAICEIFDMREAVNDPRFADFVTLQRHWLEAVAIIEEKSKKKTVADVFDPLQEAKFCVAAISTPAEVLSGNQFSVRDMLRKPAGEPDMTALGPVFRTTTPHRADRPAPKLGEHSDTPWTADRIAPAKPATALLPGSLPLAGLRVLDFTLAWAGPMATRGLSFLGADVIKIENAIALDPWRGPSRANPGSLWHADGKPNDNPWDRYSLFLSQNHDKKSLSLNLKSERGLQIARDLAATCDVVVANFSPRVLERLGLGYADLKALNPRIIMVEMPAFGNTGPWSAHVGVGKTMEAASGMGGLIGYGDGVPVLTGPAYLDPIGGLHGTAAVLTALVQRERDGFGQYVEVAQVEAALHWIGEFILQTAVDGVETKPEGNAVPWASPHDAFPTAGDDQWIAIAIYDDAQWQKLRDVTGIALFNDPALATLEGRLAARRAITAALADWTRTREKHDLAARLQAAGIPAAPVMSGGEVYRDPHLRDRGFIQVLDHPEVGPREYSSLAYRLSLTPGGMRTAGPLFGQHTSEILGDLGLTDTDIAALVRDEVVFLHPKLAGASA
ncbi:Formyl-CoA:oxalate CoA-transferase [Alphaproteobacteria bacterium SO-S41]|nr:Formyl-CoA:oxalate CoA-transferase [Alphaproteobacteria bacterium SO-S41]